MPAAATMGASQVREVTKVARWAVALAVFTAISRFHASFGFLKPLRLPLLLSLIGMLVLFTQTRRWQPRELLQHWMWKLIAVIIVMAVLGMPLAIVPGKAFDFLQDSYLKTILLAVMTWAVARTPRGLRFVAVATLLAGLTAGALALKSGRMGSDGRLAGAATYDANDLGLVLVVSLPLLFWAVARRAVPARLVFVALGLPMVMIAIVKTGSRGAQLGLGAVIIGFVVLGLMGASKQIARTSRVVMVLAIVGLPLMPGSFWERLGSVNSEDDYNKTSETGRIAVWKRGIGYATSNPIFGVGIGNFNSAEGRSAPAQARAREGKGWKWSTAHNSFIQLGAETGFISVAAFIALMLGTTFRLFALARPARGQERGDPSEAEQLAPYLGVSLLGFTVSGFFLSFAYMDVLYVLFALSSAAMVQIGATRAARRRAGGDLPTPAARFAPPRAVAGLPRRGAAPAAVRVVPVTPVRPGPTVPGSSAPPPPPSAPRRLAPSASRIAGSARGADCDSG